MSSNQRWIVGGDINQDDGNESDAEVVRPLLPKIPKKTPFLRMLFFGSIIAAPYILAGMVISFSAIALPQMKVNIDEASWFGSLSTFGALFGSICIGLIIDKYGRRPSFIFSIIPCIIGWILLAIGPSITILYLGQFLAGIIPGCIFIGQIYTAESIVVNHQHLRNSFSTWGGIAIAFGSILDFVLGRIMSYQMVAYIAAAMALISLLCIFILIPESPQWLFQQGQIRRARDSEKRLSIYQPVLKNAKYDRVINEFNVELTWQSFRNGFQKLKRKDVYKPLIILNVWFILVVLSGGTCINAYQVNILSDYPATTVLDTSWFGGSERLLLGYNLGIISAVLVLVSVILTSILISHTGTKLLFYLSSIGMAVGMVTLGISLGVSEKQQVMPCWRVLHTSSVWLSTFFFNLGVTTLPVSVVGEMFPQDAKGFASLPSISICGIGGVVLKLHLYLYSSIGHWIYFLYAFNNVISIIFVHFCVPETVGKTLEEISEHFIK